MRVTEVAAILDQEFRPGEHRDSIVTILQHVDPDLYSAATMEYKDASGGLMLQCSDQSQRILCAAFPSRDVFTHLTSSGGKDLLLLLKHPMDWEESGSGFVPLSQSHLNYCFDNGISIYVAHAAMDNHPRWSPTLNLAQHLGYVVGETLRHGDGQFGVVCTPPATDFFSLAQNFRDKLGLQRAQVMTAHNYSTRLCVVAGGGDSADWAEVAYGHGCDTYVTGILSFNGSEYARKENPRFLDTLRSHSMNGLGGSHYLTEKFGLLQLSYHVGDLVGLDCVFVAEPEKQAALWHSWGGEIS